MMYILHFTLPLYITTHFTLHDALYYTLSLKCKTSAIWLVETASIFLIFLIIAVQISMEWETQES